jgi:hypothetical protein
MRNLKWIIIIAVSVLLWGKPCVAEVEPEGLFSIDNTGWCINFGQGGCMGFYNGDIYWCEKELDCSGNHKLSNVFILDVGIISFFGGYGWVSNSEGYFTVRGWVSSFFKTGFYDKCFYLNPIIPPPGIDCESWQIIKQTDTFNEDYL